MTEKVKFENIPKHISGTIRRTNEIVLCTHCNGFGFIEKETHDYHKRETNTFHVKCSTCEGDGRMIKSTDQFVLDLREKLELRPTMEEQTEIYNRTISEDTLRWWGEQSPEAIEEAMGDRDRITYRACMEQLYKFCWNRADKVWSNGSGFDIVIAESAFRELEMTNPWQFWNVRDCRTIYDLAGVSLKDGGYVTSHKAVEDAERQAIIVQKAYKKLIQAGMTHIR